MKSHDEIKAWISAEIAEILECDIESINPEQEFSSMGIDSLVAFAITGELSEWIGEDLSATLLWDYPTINSLSQKISDILNDELPDKQPGSNVIFLAGHEGKDKLFCICGIDLYQTLANQLDNTLGTYGVYVAPEKVLGKFNEDIDQSYDYRLVEDLAKRYMDEIVSVQPEGPYHLLGLSFGGILAYEIAQQLSRRGADIPLLVLLDSVLPNAVKVRAHRRVINLLKSGVSWLGNREMQTSDTRPDLTYEEMSKLRGQYYWELGKRYKPLSYSGPAILVRATSSKLFGTGYINDETLGWADLIADDLAIVRINGTHTGILEQPHVKELAKVIHGRIETTNFRVPQDLT
jgi:thioesterase domain-containing protein/acyl carrier protein